MKSKNPSLCSYLVGTSLGPEFGVSFLMAMGREGWVYMGGRRVSGMGMWPVVSTEHAPSCFSPCWNHSWELCPGQGGGKVQNALGSSLEETGKSFN